MPNLLDTMLRSEIGETAADRQSQRQRHARDVVELRSDVYYQQGQHLPHQQQAAQQQPQPGRAKAEPASLMEEEELYAPNPTASFQHQLVLEDVARAQKADEEDELIVHDPQASNALQVAIEQTVLPVLQAILRQQQQMLQEQQQMLQFMQQQQYQRQMVVPGYGGSGGGSSSLTRITPPVSVSVPHQLSAPAAASAAARMPSPNHQQAPNPLLLPQVPRPRDQDVLVRPDKDGSTVRQRSKQLTRIQAGELLRVRASGDGGQEIRVHMSNSNNTAEDYWSEYARGRSGNPPLRWLEATKKGWRKDYPGKGASRQAWSQRVPIYNLIEFFIAPQDVPAAAGSPGPGPGLGMNEDVALEAAQLIFERVPVSKKTGLRSFLAVSKEFKKELWKRKAWWKYGKGGGPSTDM
jgi:hypothetical protein